MEREELHGTCRNAQTTRVSRTLNTACLARSPRRASKERKHQMAEAEATPKRPRGSGLRQPAFARHLMLPLLRRASAGFARGGLTQRRRRTTREGIVIEIQRSRTNDNWHFSGLARCPPAFARASTRRTTGNSKRRWLRQPALARLRAVTTRACARAHVYSTSLCLCFFSPLVWQPFARHSM